MFVKIVIYVLQSVYYIQGPRINRVIEKDGNITLIFHHSLQLTGGNVWYLSLHPGLFLPLKEVYDLVFVCKVPLVGHRVPSLKKSESREVSDPILLGGSLIIHPDQ